MEYQTCDSMRWLCDRICLIIGIEVYHLCYCDDVLLHVHLSILFLEDDGNNVDDEMESWVAHYDRFLDE